MSVALDREKVMQDLYQLIGRLEQSAVDMRADISELRDQIKTLHTTLDKLQPTLKEASEHAADWNATKKRGILYLAAAGATGIFGTLGLQKMGPFLFAILK